MTDQLVEEWTIKIDKMSQIEMARLWRFAPSGHPCFDSANPLFDYFKKRFDELGGFTPEISKSIDRD